MLRILAVLFAVLPGLGGLSAQTPVVSWTGETMRLRSASVTPSGGSSFAVTLTMENDNQNASLPSGFRRWWHCEIGSLQAAGTTLTVTVTNAGYTDVILPVWAQSTDGGATFSAYTRMPVSAVPTRPSSTSHRFTIATPPGVDAIRIAKYFPYTVTRKNAFVQGLASHPHVRSTATIGQSRQGRPLQLIELTDASVPDIDKRRVWIHAGIHPAETTSYFVVEGLVAWLGSRDPLAEVLLDHAIVDIVPMANPDGVWLGNYRTNAASVNLENEWGAPYNSAEPEIIAMRARIESFMGTPAAPGANPIDVVLNLHSTHGGGGPFHFQHVANANWSPTGNSSGVLPIVNALEGDWITEFEAASPFVAQGSTQSSTLGSRPYVESMMHDRWTAVSSWTGAPAFEDPVMAITFEGTYGHGPTSGVWNTEADYRLVGEQMGQALAAYFGLQATASAVSYGSSCHGLTLLGQLTPAPGGHQVALTYYGAHPNSTLVVMLGFTPQTTPLPASLSNCLLQQSAEAAVWQTAGTLGIGYYTEFLPSWSGLEFHAQLLAADFAPTPIYIDTSNGLTLRNDF